MLVSVIADAIALRYLPNSIMTEKLSRRGLDVHQEFEADILKQVRVRELMRQTVPTIPAEMAVQELGDRIAKGDRDLDLTRGLPVIAQNGELAGLLTQSDLLRAVEGYPSGDVTVLDVATKSLLVAYPDERAFDGLLFRMLQHNVGRLPVVDRANSKKMVGYLNRSSVLGAWTRQFEHDNIRETGWLRRFFPGQSGGAGIGDGALIGKIIALDESKLKVAVAGEPEARMMEFELHEALRGIAVGDQVRIQYHAENEP